MTLTTSKRRTCRRAYANRPGTTSAVAPGLVALGEHQRAREGRLFLQQALEPTMRSLADRIFQRRTVAFVTGFDTRHDISVVIISFEPASDLTALEPPHP